MANIKSAKKRILVAKTRNERNKSVKSAVKTAIKKVEAAVAANDKAAAEAALKKSSADQASANKYLNAIIKRAIPSASDVTATEALVLKERRKELVMEGHRFYDIMRLGITVTRKGGYHFLNNTDLISPSYQDYRTILAIPQSEIDVNPNIKQNEGYF